METIGSDFYVGGRFLKIGGVSTGGIATFDGTDWHRPFDGTIAAIYTAIEFQQQIIAGGRIDLIDGMPASNIVRFDGTTWTPLGDGFDAYVNALAIFNGELIAAGDFTMSGASEVNHIARWDGQAWQPLGSGIDDSVYDLVACNGALYARGYFTTAGGVAARDVARWNGANWSAIPPVPDDNANIESIGCLSDMLVLSGDLFTGPNDYRVQVGMLDGSNWVPLGDETQYGAYHFTEFQGNWYAQVILNEADVVTTRWNGTQWEIAGGDHQLTSPSGIFALHDRLVVPGRFRWPGQSSENGFVVGNGVVDWDFMSVKSPSGLSALLAYEGDWLAFGLFSTAGNHVAMGYSRWTPACERGDLDCSGVVDLADAAAFANALVGDVSASACELMTCDMNRDNVLDGSDLALFVNALLTE